MIKKILCVMFSVIMIFGVFALTANAAGEKLTVCRTADEMMSFVIIEDAFTVPIRIVPATVKHGKNTYNVYLVALMGVKPNNKQVNSAKNLVPVAFNKQNEYLDLVKGILLENLPNNARVLLMGHSMGGMVAQQLRCDPDIVERFRIFGTVTCGSPYIITDMEGEGELTRLVDKYDLIPFMSPATVVAPKQQFKEVNRENGGYFFKPGPAHTVSYMSKEEWGDYDALGNLGDNYSVSFYQSKVVEYGVVPA